MCIGEGAIQLSRTAVRSYLLRLCASASVRPATATIAAAPTAPSVAAYGLSPLLGMLFLRPCCAWIAAAVLLCCLSTSVTVDSVGSSLARLTECALLPHRQVLFCCVSRWQTEFVRVLVRYATVINGTKHGFCRFFSWGLRSQQRFVQFSTDSQSNSILSCEQASPHL